MKKKIIFLLVFVVNVYAVEFAINKPGDFDRGFSAGYNTLKIEMFKEKFQEIAKATTNRDRYVARAGSLTGAIKGTCGRLTFIDNKGKSTGYLGGFEKGCFTKGNEIYQESFNVKSIPEKESKKQQISYQSKSKENTYTFDRQFKVIGYISTEMYYGPPGYGEDPEYDKKLYAHILRLDKSIKVVADSSDELNYTTMAQEIQLSSYELYGNMQKAAKAHKKVK